MAESLAHVVLAALTALAWLGAGSLLLRPFESTGDRALDALNRLGAGAVGFALLTFAAGYLGLLYRAAYLPLFAVTALVGAFELRRLPTRTRTARWPRWELAVASLVAAYAVVAIIVTCAPISSADALAYHAAAPELYAQDHRITELPWSWHTYSPFTQEMLVLDGFLLWDSIQGAFAPLLLGFAAAAVVFLAAYRLAGRRIALLACTLLLAQPFALWLLTSTFVEPAGAFTVAIAAANIVQFARTGRAAPLVLAGVFTGATAGMKYVAAGAGAVLALTAFVALRRRLTLRHVVVFAGAAVAVALPWYVKNLIVTGDPIYPLLDWPNAETRAAAHESFANYGYGHSIVDFVLLPVRLLVDAEPFDRAQYISPLFLAFAPVALLRSRGRNVVATALAGCALYVVVWFLGVQDSRYLFFAMPVVAVLAAIGIDELATRPGVARMIAVGGTAGALAVGAAVSTVYASQFVPAALGIESRSEFLRQTVSYEEGTDWLNRHLPADARVAVDYVFVLQSKQRAIPWTAEALPTSAGPTETRAFVRRYRLTHALVFATNVPRLRQLRHVGGVRIARVVVHAVRSRARSEVGPPETMEVYRIASP